MSSSFPRGNEIYSGKAKTIYTTDDDRYLIMHYRDDATAFNALKKQSFARKGLVNNYFNAHIMTKLQAAGINTHFERLLNDNDSLVKRLTMLPLECVVRNLAAGGLVKRLGVEEGLVLEPPILEFFLKNDGLGDPAINESHIHTFKWATDDQVQQMKELTLKVNEILKPLFLAAGMILVDYKLEFGVFEGQLLLGDEFTPDGCRIWDAQTRKKMDKDRFRQDLGDVIETYEEVAHRLGIKIPQSEASA
jgi:phosphoribosylaminoimidazole-succinocarboxamide synthase